MHAGDRFQVLEFHVEHEGKKKVVTLREVLLAADRGHLAETDCFKELFGSWTPAERAYLGRGSRISGNTPTPCIKTSKSNSGGFSSTEAALFYRVVMYFDLEVDVERVMEIPQGLRGDAHAQRVNED